MRINSEPPSLREVLPDLVGEIQGLLVKQEEPELAAQVPALRIVDRCRCGDDFCGTFYTQFRSKDGYAPDHRNVVLSPKEGMLILDVIEGRIVCVEALYRDEIRQAIVAAVP